VLVKTNQDLEDLSQGDARSVYDRASKRKGRRVRDIASGMSPADITKTTVSRIWTTDQTGYHSLKQSQGEMKMSKLAGSDLIDLRRALPGATIPQLAAALWMTERATAIASRE